MDLNKPMPKLWAFIAIAAMVALLMIVSHETEEQRLNRLEKENAAWRQQKQAMQRQRDLQTMYEAAQDQKR